jgi:hypothetical protein
LVLIRGYTWEWIVDIWGNIDAWVLGVGFAYTIVQVHKMPK